MQVDVEPRARLCGGEGGQLELDAPALDDAVGREPVRCTAKLMCGFRDAWIGVAFAGGF